MLLRQSHLKILVFARILFTLLVSIGAISSRADDIKVAVAANFTSTLQVLAQQFEQQTGHKILASSGATGSQKTQIEQGAPFDIFFAADTQSPKSLEESGKTIASTRFTYAIGKIVLWSPKPDLVDKQGNILLKTGQFNHLAIANPSLAPYGLAASKALTALGLWTGLQPKLVQGNNIGQTFQFVQSGAADLGFVALAQIQDPATGTINGSYWIVPGNLYDPLEQQAVLIHDTPAARAFLAFVKTESARKVIAAYGYEIP